MITDRSVIPAKAGIQRLYAAARTTLGSRLRGNDEYA